VVISPPSRSHVRDGGLGVHARPRGWLGRLACQESDISAMTVLSSFDALDPFSQNKVDLWHAASLELSIGPEADDPFVQPAVHALLEWLRTEPHR
jgi:hypothetical protein